LISDSFNQFNNVKLSLNSLPGDGYHPCELVVVWPKTAWKQASHLVRHEQTEAIFFMKLNGVM